MRISALEEYGLRCLLSLAQVGSDRQLSIAEMAEKEGISVPYASKLLSTLRQTGLVHAVRGRGGGFCLARQPKEINLLEVITALGGPLIDDDHCNKYSGRLESCVHTDNCSVHHTLMGLSNLIGEFLGNVTLEDVLEGRALASLSGVTGASSPAGGCTTPAGTKTENKNTFEIE
ncbi:MAG: Rrf2 family transcriptional regulator [Candidatus Zixiibacteriota bacterium]|nr:MAG: Rrf2 family transcriptional regulator [candidate division Zixibacteria bacterium]